MIAIFLEIVPFFLLIACGWIAARGGLFGQGDVGALTTFVFYFPLSAMLFSFTAELPISEIFNRELALAYLAGSAVVYVLVSIVALWRRIGIAEAAVEAQCAVIGNTGFLGLPMLVILLGQQAAGPILLMLAVDLIVFGSLLVAILVAAREKAGLRAVWRVFRGLLTNPMILSMLAGLGWSYSGLTLVPVAVDFLELMRGAATPGALFAIGASLASKSAERFSVALWLSLSKLVLHPLAVAIAAIFFFDLTPQIAAIAIANAAMPTAGNIFILAQHYGVAPLRVSSSILVSTLISIVTLTAVIAFVRTVSG